MWRGKIQLNYLANPAPVLFIFLLGCAAPLRTDTVSFRTPESYPNHKVIEGLYIAVQPIDSPEKSKEIFGTDMKAAEILPLHLIVQNRGEKEFEISDQQVFGITADGEYTVAYNLNKAAERLRRSSIGTTAVTRAVAGAVAGAAVGAAIGAGAGYAAGDAAKGAAVGAAVGGATGAAAGTAEGLSDSFTVEFKKQLANLAFGDRVVFPSDIQQGFVYMKWKPYKKVRVKVFNITNNRTYELYFDMNLRR
jgi:hypothetical protein